jgi:serine protease
MPQRRERLRRGLFGGLLLALAACGGGGGGPPIGKAPPPPGLAGHATAAESDLGMLVEQEPDDSLLQPFRLPPVGPDTRLEVTGLLASTDTWTGAVDLVDVLRYECIFAQVVHLTLDYGLVDPRSGGGNDVAVTVRDAETGAVLATADTGAPPRTADFAVAAGAAVTLEVSIVAGHAPWIVTLDAASPSGAGALTLGPTAENAPPPAPAPVPASLLEPCAGDHVLVRLRAGASAAAVAARHGMRLGAPTGGGSWRFALPDVPSKPASATAAARASSDALASDPDVLWAEPDWRVHETGFPDDPDVGRQWNLRMVGAPAAWEITEGDPSVVVGVVDTGIVAHPDLDGQTVPGYDFISDTSISGDGNGRDADPTDMGDKVLSSGFSSWHGANVTSIIAARAHDGVGITGLAPGCRVMPLRALGVGGGLVSDVSDAIRYAAGQLTTSDGHRLPSALRVVNCSFGLSTDSPELHDACDLAADLGVLVVAATGNTGGAVLYPAAYDSVFAVGAVDGQAGATGYSSYGPEVDIAAPGGRSSEDAIDDGWPDGVLGCTLDETVFPVVPSYAYLNGTSQAAPHVAAAAALLLSLDPTLDVASLRTLLTSTARDIGTVGRDNVFGAGLLQVHEALKLWLQQHGMPLATPPRLLLLSESMKFGGYQAHQVVPLLNAGGGQLEVANVYATSDDGGPWLTASLATPVPGGPVNVPSLFIDVNRGLLPMTSARYAGTVVLEGVAGPIGAVRVATFVNRYVHAGLDRQVIALEAPSGILRGLSMASATCGYRWRMTGLPAVSVRIRAGEDLDDDGFYCEASDPCGWYGGTTEEDAAIVPVNPTGVTDGLDVFVRGP